MTDLIKKTTRILDSNVNSYAQDSSPNEVALSVLLAVLVAIRDPSDEVIQAMVSDVEDIIDEWLALDVFPVKEAQSRKEAARREMRATFARGINQLIKELVDTNG